MIGSLTGTISIVDSKLLVDVQGVGYLVTVSPRILNKMSAHHHSEPTTLFIHTHVREDSLDLFGFESWAERRIFQLIVSVSGVGPATAVHILSHDISTIATAIQEADVSFFTAIPRIGKKVAQKIIIELGSKLGEVKSLQIGPESRAYLDIKDSLVALGFNAEAVADVLTELQQSIDLNESKPEEVIKQALKLLSSR